MGRLTVVDAFISSSGDCAQERASLHRAIDDYNRVSRPSNNLEVRGFGPADLYPAHGTYAQAGLSSQLKDYDLHIGLWRESAGTATPSAPSGTIEELRQALVRFNNTRRPWMMCYFWQTGPNDFSQVKREIEKNGWYYHGFNDPQHLGTLFFNHLSGYIRDEYRLPGHSTTRLESHAPNGQARSVLLSFRVFSPTDGEAKMTFERPSVTVGRQRERSDIVLTSALIHREQGSFVWKDGVVFYIDFAGDARHEPGSPVDGDTVLNGLQTVRIGDAIVMPDGTRIVLKAVVD